MGERKPSHYFNNMIHCEKLKEKQYIVKLHIYIYLIECAVNPYKYHYVTHNELK